MHEEQKMIILYGMTRWSAQIVKMGLISADYICDKRAVILEGDLQLKLAGVPVINLEQLKNQCNNKKVIFYICVGTNKKAVKGITSDIERSGIDADIIDIFADKNNRLIKRICQYRIKSNSGWCGEGIEDDKYVVVTNNEEYSRYQGLLSNIQAVIGYVYEARIAGYNPLVDLRLGKETLSSFWSFQGNKDSNGWDCYFTQPNSSDKLDDLYRKHRIRYVNKNYGSLFRLDWYDILPAEKETYEFWSGIIKENLHLRNELFARVESNRRELFGDEDVLGVAIRSEFRYGGENGLELYNGHPIVGKVEEYISGIEKRMHEWGYKKVFLMVDDREYHDRIKEYFGDAFISLGRPLARFFRDGKPVGEGLPLEGQNNDLMFEELNEVSSVEKTESYLIETYLLSMCDSLFCTPGSAQSLAYLLNDGGYKNIEVDYRGRYEIH